MTDLLSFLPGFGAAYAILIIASSSPGPAVAFLLGLALSNGRAPALTAALGITAGSVLLNLVTLLGVGLILSQIAWAMTLLKLAGGAYLLWLAWGSLKKAVHPPDLTPLSVAPMRLCNAFVAGFLLQIMNPKAIAFWLAIATVGATQGGGPMVVLAFVVGAFLISFGCHGAWALLLSSTPIRTSYATARRWVDATLGAFFIFAGLKLALSRT
ncbi:MAG: LysE family translocator [Pseudomonadota bacterium]